MNEVLPPGVGRVPSWWMEITPHYTLDEDDEQARQMAEDQMAFYYMQLAAADDAGFLLPDGSPKLGADMKPLVWKPTTPWNGRSGAAGGVVDINATGPGGRTFKSGHAVVDPKLFGILESDPDYKAYLTGAKLPPGYFETMGALANSEGGGTQGILNNLKQTDYGRYGRQAEAPNFKPVWAKKKLRSTTTGANIRQGQYNDSPNKFVNRRRVESNETPAPEIDPLDDEDEDEHVVNAAPSLMAQIEQNRSWESSTPEPVAQPSPSGGKKKLVRKVRKVVRKNTSNSSVEAPVPELVKDDHKTWSHSDYVYNEATQTVERPKAPMISEQELKLKEQQEKLKKLQELQRQQQELLKAQKEKEAVAQRQKQQHEENEAAERVQRLQQQQEKLQQLKQLQLLQQQQQQQMQLLQQQQMQQQQPEYDEMSYEEEEIDDDYTEGSYEEEVIDDDDNHNELMNLQNILAAKQAELQRLQAQA